MFTNSCCALAAANGSLPVAWEVQPGPSPSRHLCVVPSTKCRHGSGSRGGRLTSLSPLHSTSLRLIPPPLHFRLHFRRASFHSASLKPSRLPGIKPARTKLDRCTHNDERATSQNVALTRSPVSARVARRSCQRCPQKTGKCGQAQDTGTPSLLFVSRARRASRFTARAVPRCTTPERPRCWQHRR